MFVCRACAKRASTNLLRRIPTADGRLAAPARTFATDSTRRHSTTASEPQNLSSDQGSLQNVAVKATDQTENNRALEGQKELEKMKRAVKIELRLTTDPYHIAENVNQKLENDEFEKALMLTREASKDKQVVVSWNALIRYELGRQRVQPALKLYNEMKKRAQLPNAQTYTTIFNGCAESRHPKIAVTEALRIYNTMLASNRLKPNQIHLNALLTVCSRAEDIESLFVVLRSANGVRSPDTTTYTIILNALRNQRENIPNPNEDEKEQHAAVKESRAKTISRARLVWEEVMSRWRKGEIAMDEALMCAMGRVLLLGGASETDAILGVVCEVLDIRKLRDGEPGMINPAAQKKSQSNELNISKVPDQPKRIKTAELFEHSDQSDDFASSRPQEATVAAPLPQNHPSNLSTPAVKGRMAGNNTLSLVMRALASARRTKLAARYWDYLVCERDIVPDRRNYRDYIDCLSTGNASGKAARVLVSMPASIDDGNLYRRGLLLCHFDAFNPVAFENAAAIHRAMVRKLRVPDPRCMKLYLSIAIASYRQFTDRKRFPTDKEGRMAHAQQIITALDDVWEPLARASNDIPFTEAGLAETTKEAWQDTRPLHEEICKVQWKFISASDKLLAQNLMDKYDPNYRIVRTRRTVLHHKLKLTYSQYKKNTGERMWVEGETKDEREEFSVPF